LLLKTGASVAASIGRLKIPELWEHAYLFAISFEKNHFVTNDRYTLGRDSPSPSNVEGDAICSKP
jgi:hypothetical protein